MLGSNQRDGSTMSGNDLDHHDEQILGELQRDARITMAELGRRVKLSQPAVTERVRKLETSGVITGYHASVDPIRLGYGIRALVRVGRLDYSRVIKCIEETPEVLSAYNVTGEDNWILEIVVINVTHLDQVLKPFCALTDTSTAVILNVARERAPLSTPAALQTARNGG
jgi:Lrp/AsnC family leucine-responsive transcriptional regulator